LAIFVPPNLFFLFIKNKKIGAIWEFWKNIGRIEQKLKLYEGELQKLKL
jgi:hypothetical protein